MTMRDLNWARISAAERQNMERMRKRRRKEAPPEWLRVGSGVDYHSIIGGPVTQAGLVVRDGPRQLSAGDWVVWLEGKGGCVAVEAVTPAKETP